MPRYQNLTPERMTPEQRQVVDNIANGPRKSATHGPFMAWLPSPKFADLAQALGAQTRFGSSLPAKHYELAILMTAKQWRAQFEWHAHAQIAVKEGIKPEVVQAIHRGEKPAAMTPEEDAIWTFAQELLSTQRVSEPTFERARKLFGDKGVVDLVGVMGYYGLVSMTLNVFQVPVPQGAALPFKE
jgi:4-carboxymuconolactone decarboxylase